MIFWRMVLGDGPTITRRKSLCIVFGRFSNTFALEGSPIFLLKLGSVFSRKTSFVLKRMFSHTWLRQV